MGSGKELDPLTASDIAQVTHRIAAIMFVVVAVGLFVTVACAAVERTTRTVPAFVALVLALAAVSALVIGYSLAWQQVALSAVTIGTNIQGLLLHSSQVKYFLVGTREISPETFERLAWTHIVVLPVVVVISAVVLARMLRFWRPRRVE